jgi:hypothetical protein
MVSVAITRWRNNCSSKLTLLLHKAIAAKALMVKLLLQDFAARLGLS